MLMTKDLIVFAILVVLVSFFLNLLVLGISKRKNRNDRTLKNINMQIKAFRNESSSTIERISTAGRECQQAVEAKVGEAEAMIKQVADSLDSLSQHHKDLAALEAVCVNYKAALEKLRISTEQAEARIQAVQAEVRKAESVNEFVAGFQSEAERLTGQLQDLKADYVRLVASTQESLKSAAEVQRNENQDMLQEFAVSLENFKSRFSEFAASEREALEACYQENSLKAAEATEAAEEQRNSILKAIEDGRAELENYRNSIDTAAADTREAVESLDAKAASVIEDVQKTVEDEKNILTTHAEDCMRLLSDKADSVTESVARSVQEAADSMEREKAALAESSTKLLDENKAAIAAELSSVDSSVADEKQKLENIIAEAEADAARAAESIRAVSSESLETIEGARRGLDDARDAFISSASEFFRSEYEKLLSSVKESYDGIRIDAEAMLEKVAGTLLETRETISILSEGETEKIADIVERLESLSGKIKSSESQLTALQEKITATKEEIFNAQQERGRLSNDIDQHQKTLQDMEQQLWDCSREMDEKKAEIVRLKVERDKISRTLQDKEDKAPDEKKSRFQDMIQEFPEDIFTGAVEDVDLSDEENS